MSKAGVVKCARTRFGQVSHITQAFASPIMRVSSLSPVHQPAFVPLTTPHLSRNGSKAAPPYVDFERPQNNNYLYFWSLFIAFNFGRCSA
jgi:hypothetical protein